MRVYKYMSLASFRKSVVGGQVFLKTSRPSEFNDPYEGKGVIVGDPSVAFAHEWVKAFSLEHIVEEGKSLDEDTLMRIVCKGNMVGQFSWFDFFDDLVRIVCFCSPDAVLRPESDLLMWSHYADSGRGVRLELELDDSTFILKDIKYSETRPKLDLSLVTHCDPRADSVFANFLNDCILTKPRAWAYELEKRLVLSKNSDRLRYASPMDEYKRASERDFVLRLPGECLKAVSLGAKIGNFANAQDLMKKVRNDGFGHVKFARAIFGDSYAYDYANLFDD